MEMVNQETYSIKEDFATIPFVEIIQPYTESFLIEIKKANLVNILLDKLHLSLLNELSYVAEVVLQKELDIFIENGHIVYEMFVQKANTLLKLEYPVLDSILKKKTENFLKYIQKIINCFDRDYKKIEVFLIDKKSKVKIIDISTSIGDSHNGECTALITLSDNTKLVYKPRNINVTNSYNIFVDWVNSKLNTDLKVFKVIDCGEYGWLEFVIYEAASSEAEIQQYYYKAGILLAITFLLGSKDCHRENVIASGKNPVLIDHETIIQPFLSNQSPHTWDRQHKIPHFSVLESILIINKGTGVPLDGAGYGVNENTQFTELEKKIICPNTIDSKRVTRFVTRSLIEKNIPIYENNYHFARDYKEYFVKGFSNAYDTFASSKEELKSCNSPIQSFNKMEVRYVWRPTFVYFKILKYMRGASFMASFETYSSKLYELLSKAYQKENMEDYGFILDFEMKQMANGDVPIFNLNSDKNSLRGEMSTKLFDYNCIENINQRIGVLSLDHKSEQVKYILQWLNM